MVVSGSCQGCRAGVSVDIFVDSVLIGEATTDTSSRWKLGNVVTLFQGSVVTAVATDRANRVGTSPVSAGAVVQERDHLKLHAHHRHSSHASHLGRAGVVARSSQPSTTAVFVGGVLPLCNLVLQLVFFSFFFASFILPIFSPYAFLATETTGKQGDLLKLLTTRPPECSSPRSTPPGHRLLRSPRCLLPLPLSVANTLFLVSPSPFSETV